MKDVVLKKNKSFKSIQQKLVNLNTKLLLLITISVLILTALLTIITVNRNYSKIESQIQENLLTSGVTLVTNTSIALHDMVIDNSFSSVKDLVTNTVIQDQHIVYGIYMDQNRQVWVYSLADDHAKDQEQSFNILTLNDPISMWAANITKATYKEISPNRLEDNSVIEFAAPIYSESERLGTIRYGINPSSMIKDIKSSKKNALRIIFINLLCLLFVGICLMMLGQRLSKKEAKNITHPINQLMQSAHIISQGDYSKKIAVSSNDEVGILAEDFEIMRQTIEEYTKTLEEKVKLRTQELQQAQQKAIEHAHKAGMAEVATGTLHNVGNILNSVITSANFISDATAKSQAQGIKKANHMLAENIDNLSYFILENPKGEKLLNYYLAIGDNIVESNKQIKEHIKRLLEKAYLISEAISAQQNYSGRPDSLTEKVLLESLIQDALSMSSGSLSKYNISVTQDIQELPKTFIQKNKMMQILVNLISNAKEAMQENPPNKRSLHISLKREDDFIILKFTDTGEGIPQEQLAKIFNHGFTTKPQGHGFGLHSCANYTTEMGGSMWAESNGIGTGATFIVKIPFCCEAT